MFRKFLALVALSAGAVSLSGASASADVNPSALAETSVVHLSHSSSTDAASFTPAP